MFGQDKGKSAYNDKRYGDAKIYYQDILSKRKNDNAAKFGLGVTAYKQKDIKTALRSLNTAKNSEDSKLASKAYYNLGNTFQAQGKSKEAIDAYENAISIKPQYAEAYNNVANVFQDCGKFEKALLYYISCLLYTSPSPRD